MIEVKRVGDFEKISNEPLRSWLRSICPFIEESEQEEYLPEEVGWLVLLDESDDLSAIKLDGVAELDLATSVSIEWAEFQQETEQVCFAVITGDSFGLVFAMPYSCVIGYELESELTKVLSR